MKAEGLEWFAELMRSTGKDDHETHRVYLTVIRFVRWNGRNFIGIIDHINTDTCRVKPAGDLADDCLFGCALFRKRIERNARRTGSPNCSYYAQVGAGAFKRTGYEDVAQDFGFWCHFLGEHLYLDRLELPFSNL